jgi:hypothetical protein
MSAGELLKMLGAGVRGPGAAPKAGRAGLTSAELAGSSFGELLGKVRAGEIASGLPVKIAPGVELPLNDEQLRRIGVAADKAEAAGATRALVVIDGMQLRLDVGVRTVTGYAQPGETGVLTGIDAIVHAGGPVGSQAGDASAAGASALLKSLHPIARFGGSAGNAA